MEVGTVPTQAPDGSFRGRGIAPPKGATDGDLVGLIRAGNAAAFEALDARYRAAILSFCRQLLSDRDEAEDAVQHTFLAAYTGIVTSEQAIEVRPWLYAIARNRCYSLLRARREVAVAELEHGTSEEPAALLERREDLRDLVLDVRRLPDDQRAALVMAELGAHSHDEIAGALAVPRSKVKALVFQARASLVATKTAREADCADIRRQLRSVRGAGLRRSTLRRHLLECPACCEYRRQLRYRPAQFAAGVLPVGPLLALKGLLARATVTGRAAPVAGGAGSGAAAAVKLGALKPVIGALAAMLSAASAVVAVHQIAPSAHPLAGGHPRHHVTAAGGHRTPAAARRAPPAPPVRHLGSAHRLGARAATAPRRRAVALSSRSLRRVVLVDSRLSRSPFTTVSRRHRVGALNPPPVRPRIGGTPGQLSLPAPAPSPPTVPNVVYGPQSPPSGGGVPPPPAGGPGDPPGDPGPGDPPHGGPGDPGPGDPPHGGPGDPGHAKPVPVPAPTGHPVIPVPVKVPPVKVPAPPVKAPPAPPLVKSPAPPVKVPAPPVKAPPAPPLVKSPAPPRGH